MRGEDSTRRSVSLRLALPPCQLHQSTHQASLLPTLSLLCRPTASSVPWPFQLQASPNAGTPSVPAPGVPSRPGAPSLPAPGIPAPGAFRPGVPAPGIPSRPNAPASITPSRPGVPGAPAPAPGVPAPRPPVFPLLASQPQGPPTLVSPLPASRCPLKQSTTVTLTVQ